MAAETYGGRRTSGPDPGPFFPRALLWSLLLKAAAGLVTYAGDAKVESGRPFQVECSALGDGEELRWTRDGLAVEDDGNYTWQLDREGDVVTSRLSVRRARPEHAGEYRCHPLSRQFHRLRVTGGSGPSPDTPKDKYQYLVRPNLNLTLDCYLGEKTDRVRVRWEKNGGPVDPRRVLVQDKRLTLRRPEPEDGGEYTCRVEPEEDGRIVDYVGRIFSVYSAPAIRPFPPVLSFLNGSELVLECQLSGGFPRAHLSWLIGNEAAEKRPGFDDRLLVMPGPSLPKAVLYVDRTDYSDANRYTCVAENPVGRAEASVLVTVRDKIIKTNEEKEGKGLILLPGKELILQCETTVCVNCTVEWLKDGDHINKSDDRIHVYETNNSLIVTPAKAADTGDYMCFINKTIIGEFINATITVRPRTQVEPFEKSINLVQGDKLNLHCNVKSGSPIPTVVWYKDGQLLNGSDTHIRFMEDDKGIPNANLIIDELEFTDRAHYMCEADNGISSSNTTILVRVKDKLAALWPFLGICAEVVILCTIIFIYEKKKVKEVDETETDRIAESRNVPDRERSQDIRQRK